MRRERPHLARLGVARRVTDRSPTLCRRPSPAKHDANPNLGARSSPRLLAPPARVWQVLAHFGAISAWAPNVDHSCLLTHQAGGVGAIRRIQTRRTTVGEPSIPERGLLVLDISEDRWEVLGIREGSDDVDVIGGDEVEPAARKPDDATDAQSRDATELADAG